MSSSQKGRWEDYGKIPSNEFGKLERDKIEINYCGKRFKGTYYVDDQRLVTVAAWNGTKTAKLGILPAERLAHMLLRDLASEQETK